MVRTDQTWLNFTPVSVKVVDQAITNHLELRPANPKLDDLDLLLGLVLHNEGIAAGILESLNVSLDRVSSLTIKALSEPESVVTSSKPKLPKAYRDQIRRLRAVYLDNTVTERDKAKLKETIDFFLGGIK